MEVNTVIMCTTIGALVGTMAGVLLMNRKIRLPATGADLAALRDKLQATEFALADANATAEDLRQQVAQRDRTLRQSAEELKKIQEQLDKTLADAEKEKLQRSVTEQLSQEVSVQNASLLKERNDLEVRWEDERRLADEKATQLTSLEEQSETQKQRVHDLTGQVEGLIAERAALSRFREQESRHRASVEMQLSAEQERAQQLTDRVAELERECSNVNLKLQEERESAARGMELLLMAQENFSRVSKPVNGEVRNGEIRLLAIDTANERHAETPDTLQSGVSIE